MMGDEHNFILSMLIIWKKEKKNTKLEGKYVENYFNFEKKNVLTTIHSIKSLFFMMKKEDI